MKIILAGGPGSGKGEASKILIQTFPALHYIGMGDIVRWQIDLKSPCGLLCEPYVSKGKLLPNHLANALFGMSAYNHDDWLLDGYPRSFGQIAFFLKKKHEYDLLAHLDVPQRAMRQRMLGRGRNDDQLEIINNRIWIYINKTLPSIMRLKELFPRKYVRIDARGTIQETNERILLAINKHGLVLPAEQGGSVCDLNGSFNTGNTILTQQLHKS